MEGGCAMPTVNVNICPEISKKNHLFRIIVLLMMLLFAVCSIVNVFFCADYNFYEFIDKTAVIETQPISEIIAANEGDDNTACFEPSFLNKNNSHIKTITKNTYLLSMIADVPKEFTLLLCFFFIFFFIFFILLPDRWTLINQKIRLDN